MEEFLQRLSQMIRDKRKELSISQEKLAEMMGSDSEFCWAGGAWRIAAECRNTF